ncbi:MAG TPA: 16S rRNA (guanine(966)-N(2))-methyltransferase RsmD [Gammaproteobacteria bacterium]|nr:16S rRNA (guanine(966)-N(2))-methyltransferase RsmD [Gammaproteobacteria bacterium]
MRVIGGTFGGRRLRAVEGHGTRPTSDRVREALFSRIEARYGLSGSRVLDMFAGTGALAIEALSRGAARAVCIESERRALETLRENVRELALAGRVRVIGDDFRRVLARLKSFDGVFIDPPYGKGLALDALGAVAELALVRVGGWVTVEVGRREQMPEVVENVRDVPADAANDDAAEVAQAAATEIVADPAVVLRRIREDSYGDTKLVLYEAEGPARHDRPTVAGLAPAAGGVDETGTRFAPAI